MMDMYRMQFGHPALSAPPTIPESPTKLCVACAAGHHDQPMLAHESCDCPCHGTLLESAEYQVAA
jgi:hypothetical protein